MTQFADSVKAIKLYADSYNFMLSRSGSFLVHSRMEALHNETVFNNAMRFQDARLMELAKRMTSLERGVCVYERNNTDYYVLYAPVYNTGWSIAVACPYVDVFSGVYDLRNAVIVIFVVGILLIAILSYLTIRYLTRPLNHLTRATVEIAAGDFTKMTPEVMGRDEMRQLRDAFEYMRISLIGYTDELRRTTALKERMESDLRIARDIQLGMLPKDSDVCSVTTGVSVASRLIPAREVGGDLYNFCVEGGKLYFIVGDVSGKGVAAALHMAVICRMFRSVAHGGITPAGIISMLNKSIVEDNDSSMFCTAFVGVLDITSGKLSCCNAGHNPPIVYGAAQTAYAMTTETNIPLGVIADFDFKDGELTLEHGSCLLVFTDGITEAANVGNELYGDARLLACLDGANDISPQSIADNLLEDIYAFSCGCEQSDDITLLCVELK